VIEGFPEFFQVWHTACDTFSFVSRLLFGREFGTNCSRLSQTVLTHKEQIMLHWALVFLVIALIAGVLGFSGVYVAAAGIAKILFFVFLVLFVISLLTGGLGRRQI
jgi:uncharacterized membrane protein YtjA (UPF0391 family)